MACKDISCRFITCDEVKVTNLFCNLTRCSDFKTFNCPLSTSDFPDTFPDSCLITEYYPVYRCTLDRCIDFSF